MGHMDSVPNAVRDMRKQRRGRGKAKGPVQTIADNGEIQGALVAVW